MTGLLHDREAAKRAVEELKNAGFTGNSILVAMQDETEQESFVAETQAQAMGADEIPSLPDLSTGQVLVMVEAEGRADGCFEYTQSQPCSHRRRAGSGRLI